MKKLFITFFIFIFLGATSYASQRAITDTGKEVILKNDGTWEYADSGQKVKNAIQTNKMKFQKPKDASFKLKSSRNKSAYWINTDKWSFKKSTEEGPNEYIFILKGKDIYANAITEAIDIGFESLTDIAFDNARKVAPDVEVISKEYRIVNDKKVIFMQMNGTLKDTIFTYIGYYYSDASGCTQLVAYSTPKLIDKYKSEIVEFLNGFDTQ